MITNVGQSRLLVAGDEVNSEIPAITVIRDKDAVRLKWSISPEDVDRDSS